MAVRGLGEIRDLDTESIRILSSEINKIQPINMQPFRRKAHRKLI